MSVSSQFYSPIFEVTLVHVMSAFVEGDIGYHWLPVICIRENYIQLLIHDQHVHNENLILNSTRIFINAFYLLLFYRISMLSCPG